MKWTRGMSRTLGDVVILMAVLLGFACMPAFGADKKNLPARKITVATEYTGVTVPMGEDVEMDLFVKNGGRSDEKISLAVTSVPEGWTARIKTYEFTINGVYVASDDKKTLKLRAEPAPDVAAGEYAFTIAGVTEDKARRSECRVTVTVKAKEAKKKAPGGIDITASYPVLTGPTDAKLEFSIEVESKLEEEGIFNITAKAPDRWEVSFKPAYEDKYISSLRLKDSQSQTVAVEVKPYLWAKPGEYPVTVKVGSPEAEGDVELKVILTGTQRLDAGTSNGLLSLNAVRGKEANLTIYIKNNGSADLENIQLLSLKPENWKVEFDPKGIDILEPDEMKQVEVMILPSDQALVGDYSVGLSAETGNLNKDIELRVTVRASTAWGWMGIGLIVLVIVGLVGLFLRLGRR